MKPEFLPKNEYSTVSRQHCAAHLSYDQSFLFVIFQNALFGKPKWGDKTALGGREGYKEFKVFASSDTGNMAPESGSCSGTQRQIPPSIYNGESLASCAEISSSLSNVVVEELCRAYKLLTSAMQYKGFLPSQQYLASCIN